MTFLLLIVCVILRSAVVCSYNVTGTFVVSPRSALAPLDSVAAFNCSVARGLQSSPQWIVRFADLQRDLYSTLQAADLSSRGVYAVNRTAWDSTLLVNASLRNNGTQLQCAYQDTIYINRTDKAELTIFGPPSNPTDLKIVFVNDSRAVISWTTPHSLHGTRVWYRVYGNQSGFTPTLAFEEVVTTNSYLVYAYQNLAVTRCVEYQFAVRAENEAGVSALSTPLRATLPKAPRFVSYPNCTLTLASTSHVTVYINLQVQFCGDFSVRYTIELRMRSPAATVIGPFTYRFNGSGAEIVLNLNSNSIYEYNITASNAVGSSTARTQMLYTTDIQSSAITGGDHLMNVTCSFAEGAQAKGCVVCLERSGEVVYRMVPRVNETAQGAVRTEFPADCYNISVVDWELDGSIGIISVPIDITIKTKALSSSCQSELSQIPTAPSPSYTFSHQLQPLSISLPFYSLILVIIGVVVIAASLVSAIFITYTCFKRKKNFSALASPQTGTISNSELSDQPSGFELRTCFQSSLSRYIVDNQEIYCTHFSKAAHHTPHPCSADRSEEALYETIPLPPAAIAPPIYATLENPCESVDGGPSSNSNLHLKLAELQPNTHCTSGQSSPTTVCDDIKIDSTPSPGTDV